MKKKYFSLLAYILFLTVVSINPVQAEPADIVLYSFDPQDDYDCFMEYSCYAGEDMSYIAEELSNLKVNACTKNPFSASPDTVYYLQADWSIEGQAQTDTEYDNIHFTLSSTPGRYEITGKVIIPRGFRLAEDLQPPTVRLYINVLAEEEKKEITNLNISSNLTEILHPEIVYKDNENYMDDLSSSFYSDWIGTTSDLSQFALLDINWDFSSVDISHEGTYEARLTLSINEEFENRFYIADENACYTKTIYVSDAESWNFYVTIISPEFFSAELSRTPAVWYDLEVYCLQSEKPLDKNAVRYSEFSLCDTPEFIRLTPGYISFKRSQLDLNTYYYFFFKAEGEYSNVICILDNGTNQVFSTMEGNRDGGDSAERPDTPEINQPVPDPPDTENLPQSQPDTDIPPQSQPDTDGTPQPQPDTDTPPQPQPDTGTPPQPDTDIPIPDRQTDTSGSEDGTEPDDSSSNGSKVQPVKDKRAPADRMAESKSTQQNTSSDSPSEKAGKGITGISGTRLSYLYQEYGDYIPFSAQNITVKIPSSFLKGLDMKDSDILTVDIQKSDDLSFRLRILVNSREVFPHTDMKVTVRIGSSQMPDTLFFEGKETDIEITEVNGYASFEIQTSGFYELKYQDDPSLKCPKKRKAVPAVILLVSAIVILSVYFLHSKRKQVKNRI